MSPVSKIDWMKELTSCQEGNKRGWTTSGITTEKNLLKVEKQALTFEMQIAW